MSLTAADETPSVGEIVARIGSHPTNLIAWLQAIQSQCNYLPVEMLEALAELTGVAMTEITGVATFYNQFRLQPAGEHFIRVCIGTACHVKGADRIYDAFRSHLQITGEQDTDPQSLFTVERVACLGCCMLAPAVQIDETIYGPVEPANVPRILQDFLGSRSRSAPPPERGDGPAAGSVRVCTCSSCRAAGSDGVLEAFHSAAARLRLPIELSDAACTGVSYDAPVALVRDGSGQCFRYGCVKPGDAERILLHHLPTHHNTTALQARILQRIGRWLAPDYDDPVTRYPADLRQRVDAPYWLEQKRIATEHAGELPPLSLKAYRQTGGFAALRECLLQRSPQEVIDLVEQSRLRGRGGAGYPTGLKWGQVSSQGATPVIVCNGDEGDPGAFMDRMLLESFPYRIIEGISIAAYAIGANEGIFYVRHEYPIAVERLREAIRRCEEEGWLGENIQASGFCLKLRIVEGAGAFVCGEETALLASLEGRRGNPRLRPPYPAQSGLHGRPTLVNNVETYACVPWIVRNRPAAFHSIGTTKSSGTKTFALAGRVQRGGLVEVPMGMTLRQIVEDLGGGIPGGRELKAVQVGGPSGGCVPASLADTPVDFEALGDAGAIMGSGGMIVLDESDCMVDIARYFLAFTQGESCGKCAPCRTGTHAMLAILDRLCEGNAHEGDLEQLQELAETVSRHSICGLGRTAPNPVLSTLKHFRAEFEAHLVKHCPAGRCKALIRYEIDSSCIGCTRCVQNCPADAIPLTPHRRHKIDHDLCTKCDACRKTCPVGAVKVLS